MEHTKPHILPYRTYLIILAALLILTFISIGVTSIELGELTVTAALVIASVKSYFVLTYFMHLKYDKTYIKIMVGGVIALYVSIIVVNFFDYYQR